MGKIFGTTRYPKVRVVRHNKPGFVFRHWVFVFWVAIILMILWGVYWPTDAHGATAPASLSIGNPFCNPQPPLVDAPDEGLPGVFLEKPKTIIPSYGAETVDPDHLFATSGLGGMSPFTYDLGCEINPGNWADTLTAESDASIGTQFIAAGHSATALADSVDRRAWQPTWIMTFLGTFADSVENMVETRIIVPFAALGLLATSAILAYKGRKGNVALAISGVIWVLVVVFIGAFIISGPVRTATAAQSAGGTVVTSLHDGRDPALAATESVVTAVHYQGWLRRVFGDSESSTAKTYGPQLLSTTRLTWDEYERTDPGYATSDNDRERRLKEREKLIKDKQGRFNDIAAKVKAEDPAAYEHLQNIRPSMGVAFVEMSFAFVATFFRLAVDLLLILAMILLVLFGIFFLVTIPYIVTPWGEDMGHGILNGSARAIGYVLIAAIASWLFNQYTRAALMPGLSTWWSFVLLLLGTFAFWTAVRPDRKALNLMTMGRVRGNGKMTKHAIKRAMAYAGIGYAAGRVGSKKFAHDLAEEMHEDDKTRGARYALIAGQPLPQNLYAPVGAMPPYAGPDGLAQYQTPAPETYQRYNGGAVHVYDPLDRDGTERARIAAQPLPTPPPAGAESSEPAYQRPVTQRSEKR